jgi:hypothetical protein
MSYFNVKKIPRKKKKLYKKLTNNCRVGLTVNQMCWELFGFISPLQKRKQIIKFLKNNK